MAGALERTRTFGARRVGAALVDARGVRAMIGDCATPFPLASVTKPLVAYAALIAAEEETISLDEPAGPPGATVAHLLAHASGLSPEDRSVVLAPPGLRRIYSSAGFEVLGDFLEQASDIALAAYLEEAVFAPLGMGQAALVGGAGAGGVASVLDLAAFATELLAPSLVDRQTLERATSVAFPGLSGVLPGFGRQEPCDFGLGFEVRGHKSPHWTGSRNSPATFGHFGQSGTFLWVDPVPAVGLVVLSDRPFGDWARLAWPALSDAVLAELEAGPTRT